MDDFYVGQCVDWTFPFTEPDGSPADLTLYDRVEVRFGIRNAKRPQVAALPRATVELTTFQPGDGSMVPNVAVYHSEVDLLSEAGDWVAQAWARKGVHWTPSREEHRFRVMPGVPAVPAPAP